MGVKSDRWIREMAERFRMIEPFEPGQVRRGISYGVSAYGYDFRLADEFKRPAFDNLDVLDPKANGPENYRDDRSDTIVIPPGSFILGRSYEYFRIPRDVITICTGKSTYARCGLVVNVTPFEPEWEGFATLSLSNTGPKPVRVYAREGIGQLLFIEAVEVCEVSYKDKKGKYQAQKEITLSKDDRT